MSYITSIGSETAPYKFSQQQIFHFMARSLNLDDKQTRELEILYRASGIQHRYSVIPDFGEVPEQFSFFPKNEQLEPFPFTAQRMQLYEKQVTRVMAKAIENCMKGRPEIKPQDFTHLITVSCTGMFAPGPDIQLVSRLGLRKTIKRTCINFMGCYAAFNAIKAAKAFCATDPAAKVLVVCAEFCSLHFQKNTSPDHLLSAALFGDGAAAFIMENSPTTDINFSLEAEHCDLYPDGDKEMAWYIGDFGFEMRLSAYIPELVEKGILPLAQGLFQQFDVRLEEIGHFAIHPGGKRILDVVEKQLNIPKEKMTPSREVLRNFGNMSSPTVLFVLEKMMKDMQPQHRGEFLLAFAFGPGLTLESLLFKIY